MDERIYWTGELNQSRDIVITFSGDITPGYNFNENSMNINFGGGDTTYASHTTPNTFSGIIFYDRFSMSAIRQGIEMLFTGTWLVRGFLTNVADDLEYVIDEWRLYEIGRDSWEVRGTNDVDLLPGLGHTTPWHDTGNDVDFEKLYYSAYYDWEVAWEASNYQGITSANMNLPVMYEIDSWVTKTGLLNSATASGSSVTVTDTVRHLGHSSLTSNNIVINSIIPATSTDGTPTPWTPSGVSVRYVNGTGTYVVTSGSSISTAASSSTDGYVNVVIPDLSAIIGSSLQQNQDIIVSYTLIGPVRSATEAYNLTQASTIYTLSGTPITREADDILTVSGVTIPGAPDDGGGIGGGGTGVAAPVKHAEIIKESGAVDIFADNLVGITLKDRIFDDGDKGIRDIKSSIYIPEGGILDEASIRISVYDSSTGVSRGWIAGNNFNLINIGQTMVDGKKYTGYNIVPLSGPNIFDGSFTLYNADEIEISYNTTIPFGTNFILTRVYGYNWYKDSYIFEDSYEPVRREGYLEKLHVTEGEWIMEKPIVGKPVVWKKWFSVYNPNNASVKESYRTTVFPDSMSVNIIEVGSGKGKTGLELKRSGQTYTDWIMDMTALGSRDYMMEVTTPPVMETSRYVDVMNSNETIIRFMVNVTLDNFAEEFYENISFIFKTTPNKIISIIDGPHEYPFSLYGEDLTEIFVGDMKTGDQRRLTITYEEKPPILITAMNAINYLCADDADITAIVIPSETESGSYIEIEVAGPEPDFKTVHAQLKEVGYIEMWEEVRIPVSIDMSNLPSGRYLVYTSFKRDFNTILSDQIEFTIDCPSRDILSINWMIFIVIALVITGYLVLRIRRKKDEAGIETLKKKLRSLG